MPPGRKPAKGMGCNLQRHHAGKAQGGNCQANGTYAAGSHIGNDQKGCKEDQRRTEVVHERQASANSHRISNKQDQIFLSQQSIHGGCADKNKTHFTQFRRL